LKDMIAEAIKMESHIGRRFLNCGAWRSLQKSKNRAKNSRSTSMESTVLLEE
jgi:hypothetical protein